MISNRYVEDKHYDILHSWWEAHKWTPVPKLTLPEEGWVVYDNDEPVMAAFFYMPSGNVNIGWFEWVVSRPDLSSEDKDAALKVLVESLEVMAKENGISLIFSTSNKPKLCSRFEDLGFVKGEENVTHFMKVII